MIKRYTLALVAILFLAVSCNKNKDMVHAVVIDTGDITNVGCGYLLMLDDSALVQPNYLESSFQHPGIEVKVKYTHTGVVDTCDYQPKVFDLVQVEEIELVKK